MPWPCCGPKTRMRRISRSSVPCRSAVRLVSSRVSILKIVPGLDDNPYDAPRALQLAEIVKLQRGASIERMHARAAGGLPDKLHDGFERRARLKNGRHSLPLESFRIF